MAGRMRPVLWNQSKNMAVVRDSQFKETATRLADARRMREHAPALQPGGAQPDIPADKMVLNMGPSHPATHGVLRIVLELDGEIITKAMPDVGYLHRGDEKIAENMTYTQFIPYTDGRDYLRPRANNVGQYRG